ncbi:hypothetical protein [Pseudactinotalea terrae]|uniref:hypothetical protein n=1 Tax=Pseudactinotalea terrae TaxID=1743262 RepID=UPI0012E16612|nr:hypothetical protein [Pseudactinotalea terrae]
MTLTAHPTTATQTRVPAGVHTGGRFTTTAKGEPAVTLRSPTYPGAPREVATALGVLARHGARITSLAEGRCWEVRLHRPGHQALFEIEVDQGRVSPEVYHHWADTSPDPRAAEDDEGTVMVDWQHPHAVAYALLRRAGIPTD